MTPPGALDGIGLRPAAEEDLATCAEVHRVAVDAYLAPMGMPIVTWRPGPLVALFSHLRSTDPDRFLVAERDGRIVGFTSAWVRGGTWFLAMLFVLPGEQARGIGTRLLEAVLPRGGDAGPDGGPLRLGVATDSAQPISNALYARYGMVPRLPTLLLQGPALRPEAFPELPDGLAAVPFAAIREGGAGPLDGAGLDRAVGHLDRSILRYAHPEDHGFLEATGRVGRAYLDADGDLVAYGYVREDGRLGPVASTDGDLVPAILGDLIHAVPAPADGWTLVATGATAGAVTCALRAGLRITELPTLFCWDRPIADFDRYVPIGNALI